MAGRQARAFLFSQLYNNLISILLEPNLVNVPASFQFGCWLGPHITVPLPVLEGTVVPTPADLPRDGFTLEERSSETRPVEVDGLLAAIDVGLAGADLIEEENELIDILRGLVVEGEDLRGQVVAGLAGFGLLRKEWKKFVCRIEY